MHQWKKERDELDAVYGAVFVSMASGNEELEAHVELARNKLEGLPDPVRDTFRRIGANAREYADKCLRDIGIDGLDEVGKFIVDELEKRAASDGKESDSDSTDQ